MPAAARKPEQKPRPTDVPTVERKPPPGFDPTRKEGDKQKEVPRYLRGDHAPAAAPAKEGKPGEKAKETTAPRYLRGTGGEKGDRAAAERQGAGEPLSPELASKFSRAYGQDLSGVRVHADSPDAKALGARAFTTGNTIGFAPGAYQPGTPEGQRLVGHELAHVVQQSKGAKGVQGKGLEDNESEKEADAAADAAVAGESVPDLSPAPEGAVQRKADSAPAGGGSAKVDAGQGEVDLGTGKIDASKISKSGTFMARVPSLGAAGEIDLVKNKAGDSVRSKSRGEAIALDLPALKYLHSGPLSLMVVVEDNTVTGYVAVGEPGKFISRNDKKLFGVLENTPEDRGFLGLSNVESKGPTNQFAGGRLRVGAGLDFTLGGWVKGATATFDIDHDQARFGGSASVAVGGTNGGDLKIDWSPDKGLSGAGKLSVGMGPVTGEAQARLHDGVVDVQATVGYATDRLKGSLTLIATDEKTAKDITATVGPEGALPSVFDGTGAGGAAGGAEGGAGGAAGAGAGGGAAPAADSGPRALAGWGELDFALTEWMTGQTKVVVNSEGKVTVIGKIAPPKEIILFEQKDWTKKLFTAEARAAYGLPVVGNVFVFANVGLEALGVIGPGKLHQIELNGTYSTDERADQNLDLSATLNISAFAGLRLRAEGGVGVQIMAHDIKAGVGAWALAGVRGYVDAKPTIGMRQKAGGKPEYYIKGQMDLAAQLFLGLGGDLFIEVDSPWWSPLGDEKWKFPLGSIEYPIPGEFGIGANVEYVLGQKSWPEVTFTDVEFDAGKFTSDLLRESPPKGGGGGEKKAPGKWKDGGAGGGKDKGGGNGGGKPSSAKGGGGGAGGPAKAPEGKGKGKGKGEGKPGKDKPGKDKGKGKGKDKGKGKGKDKDKGKDKGFGSIGESVSFSAGGKSHKLWVQVQGKSATLMVSGPQQSASAWIGAQDKKADALPKDKRGKAESLVSSARSLASSIDKNADQVAAGKGDQKGLKEKNNKIKQEQKKLGGVLGQIAKAIDNATGDAAGVGATVAFSGGGESHKLFFKQSGNDATLMVASTPLPVLARLADFRKRVEEESQLTDHNLRSKALGLIKRAEELASTSDKMADNLVQLHRGIPDRSPPGKEKKLEDTERDLASVLSELYDMLGEHSGESDEPFDVREPYSGAAGSGEISLKRRSQNAKNKTFYVMASGPLAGRAPGADRGRIVSEAQHLAAAAKAQKMPVLPEDFTGQITALQSAAEGAEGAAKKVAKPSKAKKPKPPPDLAAAVQTTAKAAGPVASLKLVGGGEILERALSALAAEKKRTNDACPFNVSQKLHVTITNTAKELKEKDAKAAAEHKANMAAAGPEGQNGAVSAEEKQSGPPRAKVPGRVRPGIGFVGEEVTNDGLPAPGVVLSSAGAEVSAFGNYEEIIAAIERAGGDFGPELVAIIHSFHLPANASISVTLRGRALLNKDRRKFLFEMAVLMHVEMARATASWAFAIPQLLEAKDAFEASQTFKVEAFPHAKVGFQKEYEAWGPKVFNEASVQLFKDLKLDFENKYHLGATEVFLPKGTIESAADEVKEKLSKVYDKAAAKYGMKS